MTLRLDASDEAMLREVAKRTNHTLTDAVALSIRHYYDSLLQLGEREGPRGPRLAASSHRTAIDESIERNAEALELLSQ